MKYTIEVSQLDHLLDLGILSQTAYDDAISSIVIKISKEINSVTPKLEKVIRGMTLLEVIEYRLTLENPTLVCSGGRKVDFEYCLRFLKNGNQDERIMYARMILNTLLYTTLPSGAGDSLRYELLRKLRVEESLDSLTIIWNDSISDNYFFTTLEKDDMEY